MRQCSPCELCFMCHHYYQPVGARRAVKIRNPGESFVCVARRWAPPETQHDAAAEKSLETEKGEEAGTGGEREERGRIQVIKRHAPQSTAIEQPRLRQAKFRTVIGSQGFSCTAPSTWNKLPLEIRNSSSFASFKRNHNTCYFPVPSLRPASPSPLANARASLHEVKNNGRYI